MTVFLLLWMIFAYLLGSIPTGYLIGKFLKGIDIREYGSGNPGATNVFRVVGKTAGIMALLLDCLKGYLPVQIFVHSVSQNEWHLAFIGLAAIAGHNWSVFLNFRGGKGVATSLGVFLALLPGPTLIAIGFFLIAFLATQRVSVGSMLSAISLCMSTWILTSSRFFTSLTILCTLLIFISHRKNIWRLIHNQEPKISFGKKT